MLQICFKYVDTFYLNVLCMHALRVCVKAMLPKNVYVPVFDLNLCSFADGD